MYSMSSVSELCCEILDCVQLGKSSVADIKDIQNYKFGICSRAPFLCIEMGQMDKPLYTGA